MTRHCSYLIMDHIMALRLVVVDRRASLNTCVCDAHQAQDQDTNMLIEEFYIQVTLSENITICEMSLEILV